MQTLSHPLDPTATQAKPKALTLSQADDPRGGFGVYVHVPFCERRCPYCDFSIALRKTIPHEAYKQALLNEFEDRAPCWEHRPEAPQSPALRSVYFGGGTPSLWSPNCLGDVLRAIKTRWGQPREVTIEVNPGGDIDPQALDTWRNAGVDRLSIGAQSFDPQALKTLGRTHSPDDVFHLLDQAQRAGFSRASIDLIIGRADQHENNVLTDVLAALSHPLVEQVSAYTLTIEPRTPYARQEARGQRRTAEEDNVVRMMDTLDAALSQGGLTRYEPSNSARPGRWSKHNLLYWQGCEYIGLGMGAHSLQRLENGGAQRRAGTKDLKKYLANPTQSPAFQEILSPNTHLAERIFLALRTRFYFDLEGLLASYTLTPDALNTLQRALQTLQRAHLIDLATAPHPQTLWFTTERGLRYHDEIAAEILGALGDETP